MRHDEPREWGLSDENEEALLETGTFRGENDPAKKWAVALAVLDRVSVVIIASAKAGACSMLSAGAIAATPLATFSTLS